MSHSKWMTISVFSNTINDFFTLPEVLCEPYTTLVLNILN